MVNFSTILKSLDEQLKGQLKEYNYRKDQPPAAPVNEPVAPVADAPKPKKKKVQEKKK